MKVRAYRIQGELGLWMIGQSVIEIGLDLRLGKSERGSREK
jgi:hypothetical protein